MGLTNDIPEEYAIQPLLTDSGNAARNLRKNRRGDKTSVNYPRVVRKERKLPPTASFPIGFTRFTGFLISAIM